MFDIWIRLSKNIDWSKRSTGNEKTIRKSLLIYALLFSNGVYQFSRKQNIVGNYNVYCVISLYKGDEQKQVTKIHTNCLRKYQCLEKQSENDMIPKRRMCTEKFLIVVTKFARPHICWSLLIKMHSQFASVYFTHEYGIIFRQWFRQFLYFVKMACVQKATCVEV